MQTPLDPDTEGGEDRIELGRPRPLPPELMTARQLVDAYREARTEDDRAYAVDEAESFLFALGDDVGADVLVVFFGMPSREDTGPVFDLVEGCLAAHMPGAMGVVLRVIAHDEPAAGDSALVFLASLPVGVVVRGLIAVLAGRDDDRVKGIAAEILTGLGTEAAVELFDALDDREVRRWIADAVGCDEETDDAQLMRRFTARSARH